MYRSYQTIIHHFQHVFSLLAHDLKSTKFLWLKNKNRLTILFFQQSWSWLHRLVIIVHNTPPFVDPAKRSRDKSLRRYFYPKQSWSRVDWKCQLLRYLLQITRLVLALPGSMSTWFAKYRSDHAPPNHFQENAVKKAID